jgi:hypothetical protein
MATSTNSRTLQRLQRRLAKLELDHLRQHALELHEELERTQAKLHDANVLLEYWHDTALEMQQCVLDDAHETHRTVGLTRSGELVVTRNEQLGQA